MARFIEPLLEHLAKSAALSLHAYYTHAVEDGVSARLRGYFKHWHPVARLSDAALAQKVSEDGIDILIDLSGHTAENRLLTFARKPAPVQVSWMGYPGTTVSLHGLLPGDRYFLPGKIWRANPRRNSFIGRPTLLSCRTKGRRRVNALPALGEEVRDLGSFNR